MSGLGLGDNERLRRGSTGTQENENQKDFFFLLLFFLNNRSIIYTSWKIWEHDDVLNITQLFLGVCLFLDN